jgi:hypothetical protein
MSDNPNPTYLAYLIRLWREGEATWRCTLEDPHTGERHAFADIESLLTFLREQTTEAPSGDKKA